MHNARVRSDFYMVPPCAGGHPLNPIIYLLQVHHVNHLRTLNILLFFIIITGTYTVEGAHLYEMLCDLFFF